MDRARQVVHRGVLIEMRMHNNLEVFKLFKDSIDGGRAHIGLAFLDFVGDLVGGQMATCRHKDLGDGALGDGGTSIGPTNRRDDLVDVTLKVNH